MHLKGKLQRNCEIHNYDTGKKDNYKVTYIRTTRDMNCLQYNNVFRQTLLLRKSQ